MDDKWIESIRDSLMEYEATPPDGLLESVQDEMRLRRRGRIWIFGAIAACIAIVVCISLALLPDMREGADALVAEEVALAERTAAIQESVNGEAASIMEQQNPEATAQPEPIYSHDDTPEYIEDMPHEKAEPSCRPNRIDDDLYAEYVSTIEAVEPHRSAQSPISVGISSSANGLGGMLGEDDLNRFRPQASSAMPLTRMGGGSLTNSPEENRPMPTYVEVFDHRLPVRFSVDFSWPVCHNIAVATGLTYSYLKSDIRYGYSDSRLSKASQNLHFLGIPVNLRYTPWSVGRLDIYASAGFMAEKCIAGDIRDDSSSDAGYRYSGCDERPFQFSFNAAAGLQYTLAAGCSVFIEPGVGIYLNNGSKLRTIYSERPVTFNVNVGFRFGR